MAAQTFVGLDGKTYTLGKTHWQHVRIGIREAARKVLRFILWMVGIALFFVVLMLMPSTPHIAAPGAFFWLLLIIILLNSGEPQRR